MCTPIAAVAVIARQASYERRTQLRFAGIATFILAAAFTPLAHSAMRLYDVTYIALASKPILQQPHIIAATASSLVIENPPNFNSCLSYAFTWRN